MWPFVNVCVFETDEHRGQCVHAEVTFLQFMDQHINAQFTLSPEIWVQMAEPLPPFKIYVEHYLNCWWVSRKRECVCAPSGCSRLATRRGADCVGRCCFMRQAHFYHRLVLYTSDIKLVVQSCLEKVRRAACGIISLCISHKTELVSFPAKTNSETTFQGWLKCFVKEQERLNNGVLFHTRTCQVLNVWEGIHVSVRPESACRGENSLLSLKLPLWRLSCESRKDYGSSLISLFGLLV